MSNFRSQVQGTNFSELLSNGFHLALIAAFGLIATDVIQHVAASLI